MKKEGRGKCEAYLCVITGQMEVGDDLHCPQYFQTLLDEFAHLFEVPTGLLPKREMDHQISIKTAVLPIKQPVYRYPLIQRREIEKMVQDMLLTCIIRPSNSPYSSLVLLVKKNRWRLATLCGL